MKKCLLILTVAALCLFMAGCSLDFSVEELLHAPQMTEQQGELMSALADSIQEAITLKYPISGTRRTPIQLIDLTGDGEDEAIICYSVQENPYGRFAVFSRVGVRWELKGWLEGAGTDITQLTAVKWGGENHLFIEWQSINKSEHTAVLYGIGADGTIYEVYKTAAIRILVADINEDGGDELCSVYAQSLNGPFVLRVLSASEQGAELVGEIPLARGVLECISLAKGKTSDDRPAIYVEENIDSSLQATEVFSFSGEQGLVPAAEDVFSNSIRPIGTVSCRSFDRSGAYLIPCQDRTAGPRWYRLFSIFRGQLEQEYFGFINTDFGFMLTVPEELAGRVEVATSENDGRYFEAKIINGESTEMLCQLKLVYKADSADVYLNAGYRLVGSNARYNFYMRGDTSNEYSAYSLRSFIVF